MPVSKTIWLYKYDELSPSAKHKARDWWFQCIDSSDYENVLEDAVECGKAMGVTISEREFKTVGGKMRGEPDVNWSGFSSQGDGASFNGEYVYKPDAEHAIREHAPEDKELHRIAAELTRLQNLYDHKLKATCKYSTSGMAYAHSGWMDVTTELVDTTDAAEYKDEPPQVSEADEKAMTRVLRDFADWIYEQLGLENDFLYSEENVAEVMHSNEYTFEADGTRRDV